MPFVGLVDSVMPNSVGLARRSGNSSSGSGGGGVGSLGGGVGSRFFLIGYFFGSGLGSGVLFSLKTSFGLLRRSSELRALVDAGDGASLVSLAAFLRRSSANFASLVEPPSNLGDGLAGKEGSRWP